MSAKIDAHVSFRFILALLFSLLASFAFAQGKLGKLSIAAINPTVDQKTMSAWNKDLFGIDELWFLDDKNSFFHALSKSGISDDLYTQLEKMVLTNLAADEVVNVFTFQNIVYAHSYLLVPSSLKQQIPHEILRSIYEYLLETERSPPLIRFNSVSEASQYFTRFKISGKAFETMMDRLFKIKGTYYFFFTRDVWSELSNELRLDFIRQFTGGDDFQRGLKVDLTYTANDDLIGIAKHYAGERHSRALERYLRLLLARSSTGSVTIPLSSILHPFIRKQINTYAICSGPNCFNTGLNVNQGNFYEKKFISGGEELLDKAYRRYRFVKPDEQLTAGDLMIYQDSEGRIIHVSTYISNSLVFTKNGFSKFNPYVFQTRSQNESLYFPDQKFKLIVLRLPKNNELPVSAEGLSAFRGETIYFADKSKSRSNIEVVGQLVFSVGHPNNGDFDLLISKGSKRCVDLL